MNCDGHWEDKYINHNVFLASLNLLVPVKLSDKLLLVSHQGGRAMIDD